MFTLDYRIVSSKYDEFVGENGFFQLNCNGYLYGEMYPKEIEHYMDKVSIFDWFERLVRVVEKLMKAEYVVLSDIESYNVWIEFKRKGESLIISIINADKICGSKDIEYMLRNAEAGTWINQEVKFNQFKREILIKCKKYVEYIIKSNSKKESFCNLEKRIEVLWKTGKLTVSPTFRHGD